MDYPPRAYRVNDLAVTLELMRTHPFAHVMTAHGGALRSTRVPVLADVENGKLVRLRAHLDATNPQGKDLDGASVLVSFSGPAAYVSPNWRAKKTYGGTYDYQEVQVRGRARVMTDAAFFRQLVDDLSQSIESQHREIAPEYPVWRADGAVPGHIEGQFKYVIAFTVEVESVETIAKLHQNLPNERSSVAAHLAKSHRDEVRAVAALIRSTLE